MADMFAATWATFAKTGNPNNDKIPNWPAYDATRRATMIFDSDTRVENDPRPLAAARRYARLGIDRLVEPGGAEARMLGSDVY